MTAFGPHLLARSAMRLLVSVLLVLLLGFGQAAMAHTTDKQHQSQSVETTSHHAKPGATSCGDLVKNADSKACLSQCMMTCSYCAPIPMPTAFPEGGQKNILPRTAESLVGAASAPHPRPPSFS